VRARVDTNECIVARTEPHECTRAAKVFWKDMGKTANLKLPSFHPDSWAMDMVDSTSLDEESTSLILCGCWSIWQEGNARKHGKCGRSVTESVRWVMQTTGRTNARSNQNREHLGNLLRLVCGR
jgi:hypothetical protein